MMASSRISNRFLLVSCSHSIIRDLNGNTRTARGNELKAEKTSYESFEGCAG